MRTSRSPQDTHAAHRPDFHGDFQPMSRSNIGAQIPQRGDVISMLNEIIVVGCCMLFVLSLNSFYAFPIFLFVS